MTQILVGANGNVGIVNPNYQAAPEALSNQAPKNVIIQTQPSMVEPETKVVEIERKREKRSCCMQCCCFISCCWICCGLEYPREDL